MPAAAISQSQGGLFCVAEERVAQSLLRETAAPAYVPL